MTGVPVSSAAGVLRTQVEAVLANKKSKFLRVQGKVQRVVNAKERGALVVSIKCNASISVGVPKIETRRRHAHLGEEIN